MSGSLPRTLKIVLVCLASGIIVGLLTATQCGPPASACHIGAIQSLSDEPVSWTMWLNWINWFPGILFGLLFATVALEPGIQDRPRRSALFALASGVAYLIAGLVFAMLLLPARGGQFDMLVWVWPAGFSAGLLGSLLLAVSSPVLIRAADFGRGVVSRSWLPALVGAFAGVLFVWISIYGEQQILVAWPIAFSTWQIAVGLALESRLAYPANASAPQSLLNRSRRTSSPNGAPHAH